MPRPLRSEWVIVYITAGYAIIAGLTLWVIKRQADTMERQAKEAASSSAETLAAIKRQGDWMRLSAKSQRLTAKAAILGVKATTNQIKMMKVKERARLVVHKPDVPRIGEPEPIANGQRPIEIVLEVTNEGLTKAFNVRAYAAIAIAKDKKGAPYEIGEQQEFPVTVGSTDNGGTAKICVSGFGLYGNVQCLFPVFTDEETAENLWAGRKFLQISGLLTFTDIFEDSQEFPFRYLWVSQGDNTGESWRSHSLWYDLGVTKSDIDADRQPENPN